MTNKNIITYGCRLNIYESEVIQKHMDEAGLKNCILFNSCSVTNEAKKKVINDIKKVKKISPQKKQELFQKNPQNYLQPLLES